MECGWDYTLLPPSVIKKFATDKGNANKDLMLDAFEKDTGVNLEVCSIRNQNHHFRCSRCVFYL